MWASFHWTLTSTADKLQISNAQDVQRLEQALAAANDRIQQLQTAAASAAAAAAASATSNAGDGSPVDDTAPPRVSDTPTYEDAGAVGESPAVLGPQTVDVAVRVASVEASMTYLEAENKVQLTTSHALSLHQSALLLVFGECVLRGHCLTTVQALPLFPLPPQLASTHQPVLSTAHTLSPTHPPTQPQDLLAKLEERGEESARMASEFADEIRELNKDLAASRREEARLSADLEDMRLQLRSAGNDARSANDALAGATERIAALQTQLAAAQEELAAKSGAAELAASSRSGEVTQLQARVSLLEMELSAEKAEKGLLLHRCADAWCCVYSRLAGGLVCRFDLKLSLVDDGACVRCWPV